jgi:hypothetical protein
MYTIHNKIKGAQPGMRYSLLYRWMAEELGYKINFVNVVVGLIFVFLCFKRILNMRLKY